MVNIYNTLTRKKATFVPLVDNQANIYVCGVTVYDYCHLGHARTYIAIDAIIRYLRFSGYKVKQVRNITDIDDKIIKRAQENKESFQAITERFIKAMQEDFAALNILPPNHEPKATDYIPKMIALIETLIVKQHAYVASNGDVYFDIRHFSKYGALSHHNIEQLESGARVEISEVKRDPLDFVLWKLAKPEEPAWDSPWGQGRPGWHIECSVMSMDLLGSHFDLHAGGRDLIFPHHENEIAQSEAATGQKFVNTWLHTGFLQIDKEKMSKSLGNFVTIRDVLQAHSGEVLRYFILASHYRSPLIYTPDALTSAKQALSRFYTALRDLPLEAPLPTDSSFATRFKEAMDDDFNTPIAFSVLFDLAHEIQRLKDQNPTEAASLGALLRHLGHVLGLLQQDPTAFFQSGTVVDVAQVAQLIAERQLAREEKQWAKADQIRKQLTDLGIVIEDGPTGTTWKHA